MGAKGVEEVAAGFEAKVAAFIASPMIWARNSKKKLFSVGIAALIIGFGFIFAGITIAKSVVFNIFPPTKDTNGLVLMMNFPPGTTVDQAQKIAVQADDLAQGVIGDNFVQGSYYNTGSAEGAGESIEIISYSKLAMSSP